MRKLIFAGCSALALSQVTGAHAQEAATSEAQVGLPEIIVTAQKRSENIQNVPIAVTALSGQQLATSGISNITQIQNLTPALTYTNNNGQSAPFLRGIGTQVLAAEAESSVATFIDGVYVANQLGSVINLLGVDRVEVLAGPQGTLYGRNASGGALNIYTLTPSERLDGLVNATYGKYNQAELSGYFSGGLSDTLAAGIYFAATRSDSYHDFEPSRAPGQSNTNKSWGARLKMVWKPVDALKLTGSIEHTYSYDVDSIAPKQRQVDALGYTLGAPIIDRKWTVTSDVPLFVRVRATTAILRQELDLGFADLVGITGYRKSTAFQAGDIDATLAPIAAIGGPVPSRQFSQELQLLSPSESPISWIAGLYYFREKSAFDPIAVNSAIIFAPATTNNHFSSGRTRSYAAFAQATVPLSFVAEGLRLTVGGRYTKDTKWKLTDTVQLLLPDGSNAVPPVSFPGGEKSWSKFTPKVTLEYKAGSALFYATYSQGFKSGLFNLNNPGDGSTVDPEVLNDYEVGIKSDLFDRRLRLNLAGYYYDLQNLQVQIIDPAVGLSAVLRNSSSAKAYGLEATASVSPTNQLTANLNMAWQHSEYKSFANAPFFILTPFGNQQIAGVSAKGKPLTQAPKFVITASANYRIPLASGARIDLDSSIYHNSGFTWIATGQIQQTSYEVVNASIAYTTPDKRWKGSLWVTNLTNAYRISYEQITGVGIIGNEDSPRRFGATLSLHIN
jgi:iron complex outermembrane recepter protein